MSEIELPLFPLPIALFPGVAQPLHIFEPRYRQLIADCLEGDRRFGLSLVQPHPSKADAPDPGDVGCTTVIRSHYSLPDGRSNILTVGEHRYVFKRLVNHGRLYLVGAVELFHDDPSSASELSEIADKVRRLFGQLVTTAQDFAGSSSEPITLPDDPEMLSYHVAAAVEADLAIKETLLRLTSTALRLGQLLQLLMPLIVRAKQRASVRQVAKRNGKSTRFAPPIVTE